MPDDDSSIVATLSPSFEPSPSPFVARDWNAGVEHYRKNERRQYGDHNPDCNRAHEEKGRVTGTITFWKSPKHFGFAEYADRDITVFVHADRFRRHLRDSVKTSGLQCGDEITFKVGPPGEGHSCMIALDVDLPRDQSGGGRQRSRTPPRPRVRPPYADARDVGDLPAELREASWAMAMWLRYVAMFGWATVYEISAGLEQGRFAKPGMFNPIQVTPDMICDIARESYSGAHKRFEMDGKFVRALPTAPKPHRDSRGPSRIAS